jgi:hypothetical protein
VNQISSANTTIWMTNVRLIFTADSLRIVSA